MSSAAVHKLTIFPLSIPLRRPVVHAASTRVAADPIVVRIELIGGAVGFGETLPRTYVTGEDRPGTIEALRTCFVRELLDLRPPDFPSGLEAAGGLGWHDDTGRFVPAARAAVELALLDAYSRHFRRSITDAAGWLGFHDFGPPGSIGRVRVAAVLASNDFRRFRNTATKAIWAGLRDFKVKVGDEHDTTRLAWMARRLGRSLHRGSRTLRVDANGAWTAEQAVQRLDGWRDLPIAFVEQPLARGDEEALAALDGAQIPPVMLDESLVSLDDAHSAFQHPCVKAFNIRLSKCGGFLPSIKIAHFAKRNHLDLLIGCMVGETSILSGAARRLLELTTPVRFTEGNYAGLLLRGEVVDKPLRFGLSGRLKPLAGFGWGVRVNESRLAALCTEAPIDCPF